VPTTTEYGPALKYMYLSSQDFYRREKMVIWLQQREMLEEDAKKFIENNTFKKENV